MAGEELRLRIAVVKEVELAKAGGLVLRTGDTARRIRAVHGMVQLPVRQIADMVARVAIAAGVPIQFT